MTATTTPRRRPAPTVRENLPAPSTPEGELFHYKPAEAAIWLPFSARKLSELAHQRKIPHVNNGKNISFSGLNIRSISTQFTVKPATARSRARRAADTAA